MNLLLSLTNAWAVEKAVVCIAQKDCCTLYYQLGRYDIGSCFTDSDWPNAFDWNS